MKIHLLRIMVLAALAVMSISVGSAMTPPVLTEANIKAIHSMTITLKAEQQAKVDPAAAVKLYEQALDLWPDNCDALFGLGDCKEKITGDPKSAIPYYRKGLFDSTTGDFDKHAYYPDQLLLDSALLFERAGELSTAIKLYNRAAVSLNHDEERRAYGRKISSSKGEIPNPYVPVLLPILTDKATALDLACHAYVGRGIYSHWHGLQTDQADFEAAVAIKDTPVARFYLDQFKKEHPNLYKDGKPVQAAQPSKQP